MDNVLFDINGVKIQVLQLVIYQKRLHMVLKVTNDSPLSIQYYTRKFPEVKYYSKVTGVFEYIGVIGRGRDYVEIPSRYFVLVEVVYEAYEINEGDFFEFNNYFFDPELHSLPTLIFSYQDKRWVVTAKDTPSTENTQYADYRVELNFHNKEENEQKADPYVELENLIGLDSVKKEVNSLVNFVRIQKMRKERDMKATPISYHLVFTGNAGTGKTTVARIVAGIYKDLGIIKQGQFIETDRSGLVAEYVGQTAIKTNGVIDSALDGVLFIDEAYSLAKNNDSNDFGGEAISTLLKRMEDDRTRLVVIVAGYSKEMQSFINSNSGLKSRFTRFINFEDYSIEELRDIFLKYASDGGYIINDTTIPSLMDIFRDAKKNGDRNFGNARFARNLFEGALKNQADRLVKNTNITDEDLCTITLEDIENVPMETIPNDDLLV